MKDSIKSFLKIEVYHADACLFFQSPSPLLRGMKKVRKGGSSVQEAMLSLPVMTFPYILKLASTRPTRFIEDDFAQTHIKSLQAAYDEGTLYKIIGTLLFRLPVDVGVNQSQTNDYQSCNAYNDTQPMPTAKPRPNQACLVRIIEITYWAKRGEANAMANRVILHLLGYYCNLYAGIGDKN